jgi:glucosylglycerate synthase
MEPSSMELFHDTAGADLRGSFRSIDWQSPPAKSRWHQKCFCRHSNMRKMILNPGVRSALSQIKSADIVVGIPSFNNAGTIGHVVRAVKAGLAKYFPEQRCVIVNSDGGSTDGTPEAVLQAHIHDYETILVQHPLFPIHKISTPYDGIPGKGSAFRTILRIAEELGVDACAVLDADLRSVTPEWVELLIRPVLDGHFDYVTPFYLRHKFDGTITNSIVHPLNRALYGKRIRQPIGGDFGFSGTLASFFLTQDVWDSDVARFGIDIWMTTVAICEGFRVCQTFLGAKIHDPKDPGSDLEAMLAQVVGSIFDLMETYHFRWESIDGSESVPLFGFQFETGVDSISVNVERMVNHFARGLVDLNQVWERLISSKNMRGLRSIGSAGQRPFHFPDELWVGVIYDLAIAHHKRVMNRDHILQSLAPLYMGRVASFVAENLSATPMTVEEQIEKLCLCFEQNKPYLIERW